MIGVKLRRPTPEPILCAQCGVAFRAAYTNGRCPVCDSPAGTEATAAGRTGRIARLIGDRWTAVLFGLVVAGNIVIAILVARAVGR